MKAAVTGATGIVGANLVRALLRDGHDVRVLVRETSDTSAIRRLPVERFVGDVCERRSLYGFANGCDVVFHAAAIFAYSGYSLEQLDAIAVQGTCNVLNAAQAGGASRVVMTSSTVVLGSADRPEVRDEASANDDRHPADYELSKLHQEQAAFGLAREIGLDLVVVCPALTVGAHDYRLSPSNASIVNYLNDPFRSTFPGGCNIVSARDVASGHLIAAESGDSGARYVLGGENLRWRDAHRTMSKLGGTFGPSLTLNHTATYLAGAVAESTARLLGRRPAVTRDEAAMAGRFYWYSSAAIGRLGYAPMSSEAALAEAIAWLIHRAWLNESVLDSLQPHDSVLSHCRALAGSTP